MSEICTGVRGIKMLYDSFFKETLNPEYTPERLSELLSLILKQNVTVLEALPNDSVRIADEMSLLFRLREQEKQLSSKDSMLREQEKQLNKANADKLAILRHVMQNFNLSVDDAMEAAGIPTESRDELRTALQ